MSQHDKDKKHQDDYTKVANILGKANYSRGMGEIANDTWQSVKSGLVGVPQAVVGLSNLMSGGHTGKFVQDNIWDIKKTQENIQAQKSDTAKAQQAQFESAEGFGGKLGAIWDNPMMAVDATVQSLPQMFAGGALGRGIGKMAGIQNGAVRAGVGEGTMMAGTAAENMRAENADGLLTGKETLASIGTGVAGGLLGYGGGKLAQKLGIADADTLLAGGVRELGENTAKGGIANGLKGIGTGALAEGVLEELPQTIAETALDNWANDRALTENMAGNAAMGLASGGLMGGVMGGASSKWTKDKPPTNTQNPPPDTIVPEDYTPTAPNGGGSTAVDVDEHGNIIPKPTTAMSDETALAPIQERWADQSRMIDDSTERQGFQGGLLENKGTPILDRNIALENGIILQAGDPNAYNQWLAYEREQAIAKRDENIRQGVNDITPVPTEAVAYGLASNLNNHQGVSTPLLEFSQSVVDRMVENGVDVHALTDSQDKQAQLTDILRNTDPRTFANPQSFDNWVAQNEYINQFKAVQGNQSQPLNTQTPSRQIADTTTTQAPTADTAPTGAMSANDFRGYQALNRGLAQDFGERLVQTQKPSERLGLDPNQGTLSKAAVVAVDSRVSPEIPNLTKTGQIEQAPIINQEQMASDGLSAYGIQRVEQPTSEMLPNSLTDMVNEQSQGQDDEQVEVADAPKYYDIPSNLSQNDKQEYAKALAYQEYGITDVHKMTDEHGNDIDPVKVGERRAEILNQLHKGVTQIEVKDLVQKPDTQDDVSQGVNASQEKEKQTVRSQLFDGWNGDNLLKNRQAVAMVQKNVKDLGFLGLAEGQSFRNLRKDELKTVIQNIENWLDGTPDELTNVKAKSVTDEQPQAVKDVSNGKVVNTPTLDLEDNQTHGIVNQLGLDANLFNRLKAHHKQGVDDYNEFNLLHDLRKTANQEKASHQYERVHGKTPNKMQLARFLREQIVQAIDSPNVNVDNQTQDTKHLTHQKNNSVFADMLAGVVNDKALKSMTSEQLQEVANILSGQSVSDTTLNKERTNNDDQYRTDQTSNRVLADRASTVVAGDDANRATTGIHSKTGRESTGRNRSQSANGNDRQRSTSVQPDGAQTGISERVAENLVNHRGKTNIVTAQALENSINTVNELAFALSDEMVQTGTVKDKLATNIAIIELLKQLKDENRQPTHDEKTLMAKYTGFGGLSDAFPDSNGNYKKGFETLGAKLRNLLSKEQYDNARASSTSAFFTPPSVIKAMWDIAQRLGYNGGLVLEPSAGVGAFIGHAPKNLPQKIIGTEIDPTTHAITGYLYPHANIFNQGYENLSLPDNSVDLAIGNPPYGSIRLNFKDKPHLSGKTIANSFMQGTLEQVKPNGLSIMVVSSSFMDSTDASTRKAMAELGSLVGAVRLPNTTFDEAGTAVVADIMVFKKHDADTLRAYKDGTKTDYPSWVTSGKRENDDGVSVNFNPYFDNKIAGEFEFSTGEGGRAAYTINETGSLDNALDKFVKSFDKVKPERSAKDIQKDIDTHTQAMIDSLTLHSMGETAGFIGRENGVLVQVIEQQSGHPNTDRLVKRPLSPSSVWSDSYMQDLDGRWYKLEDKKDENGKAVKIRGKDGKPLRVNEKVKVYYAEKDISAQSKLGIKGMNVLSQALEIQGLIENQLRLEQGGASDGEIDNNRKELNKAYDKFVKTFGYMNNPSNAKYIDKLPKANFILALETGYKKEVSISTGKDKEVSEPETAGKADILTKRVLAPKAQKDTADSPQDALSLSLAYTGGVDLGLMSALTGKSQNELTDTLTATGELFFDPATDSFVIRDEYLSGNVRQKLANAKEHGLTDNINALEKVLPKDVEIEHISIRLGMNWLPAQIYSEFAQKLLGNPSATIDYEPLTHNFNINGTASHTAMNEFGAGGKSPEWILDKILNSKQIRVTQTIDKQTILLPTETQEAVDMAKTIKTEFESFIYSHPQIDKIARLYNEKHNAIVPRRYNGSHLELIGKVPDEVIKLRTHQMNAVWRGVTTNAVLYDHSVGSGKTFSGIARAMERKRLGLSKKPVLVVPNHMVGQFAQDIYRLYPSANILAAGTKDFAKAKRKRLFGQIATGNYDIIVLPHSSFEFIKLSKDRQKAMLEQERDKLIEAIRASKAEQGKRESVKQLEQAKKNLETKLAKLAQTRRHDDEFSFEQMGIDDITVDEAHEFKNLFFNTKMQGVKGLGSPAGSNKAMDLWLKTQYLHQSGGSVAFMTGTPISNSAAEMHAMMRYLMPDTLAEMGLDNFDAWANTYAENVAKFEATESGQLKLATRFAREWQNMGSLMSLWQSVTDSVTNDDIKATYKTETGKEFPLPQVDGDTRKSVVVKPTAQQEQILQMILAGFAKIEEGVLGKEEAATLRLQLMDLAAKNSLDPRTINPSLDVGGKLGAVVDNVFAAYQKWHDDKGTQIIFLDRSTPKGKGDDKKIAEYEALLVRRENAIASENDEELLKVNDLLDKYDENEMAELMAAKNGGFSAYDEIKKGLIAKGIPADEIAFIQEAETDDEKTALFDKINAGRVRVIIGSSQRMGAGTNIQKRLVALHHVDAPWKPSDIEQREGRIIRQGNELYAKYGHDSFKVEINAYVTEKTADAKRWDTMAAKLGTINAIRHYNGEHTLDFQEDEENSSFQEIAAQATGNPLMRERVELTAQKEQLERSRLAHQKRDAGNRTKLNEAQKSRQSLPNKIKSLEQAQADYEALLPKAQESFDKLGITIDGQWFTIAGKASEYLDGKAKQANAEGKKVSYVINGQSVGSLSGATQKLRESGLNKKPGTPTLITIGKQTHSSIGEAVNEEVVRQVNQHHNDTPIAKIIGFDVRSYDMGKDTLLAIETADGYELTSTTLDHHATREKVENAFARIANTLNKNMGNALSNAQNQLKTANDTISQLKDKTGQAFQGEEELKAVTERLNEVQALLSNDEANNQFADDDKFDDLMALLGSRAIGGSQGKAFVPKAHYDIKADLDTNLDGEQDLGDDIDSEQLPEIEEVDYDLLTPSQQEAVDTLNALPDTDPNKSKLMAEIYALDRGNTDEAKTKRSDVVKKVTTYELVVRKAGELSEGLTALGYTVKTGKVKQKKDSYTLSMTATKGARVLDIVIDRMMNERRANDPTRNGVFVNDGGLNYSFSINEPAISQGIDSYQEYKTSGEHFGENRPQLTYTDGTTWQEQMRPELARLFDDDPRLAGFVAVANNPDLAASYKNEIRLALVAYADKQALIGNALLPHEVDSGIANKHEQRQIKANRPYFGKDRPKFELGEKSSAKKQEIAGQLARLFDDDPKLAEFSEQAQTNSPLKQAMVLNAIKDYASRLAIDGNALFMGEVLERQNEAYHQGKMKFSRLGNVVAPIAEQAKVLQGEAVSVIDESTLDVPTDGGMKAIQEWATDLFAKQGGKAINPTLGEITLNHRSVKDSLAHGKFSPYKNIAFAGVKDVLEKGVLVASDINEFKEESFYISAPITINGRENILTVTVHKDSNSQRMYLHGVMVKEGLLKPRVSGTLETKSRTHSGSLTSTDIHNILHTALNYKGQQDSRQGGRYNTTTQDALDVLNSRFGKDTIKRLQDNGSLKVISLAEAKAQFGNIYDDVDGFYTNGTAYLISDNIHPDMIVPTFLHELGGHGGLETLMSKQAYQSLLKEFHDMVARGDKTAKQAKALADKHARNQTEADSEYLAYMITLASRNNSSKIKSLLNRVIMAVKAFLKNTFGISLALTPNDILALSEKMVRERAKAKHIDGRDRLRFSLDEANHGDLIIKPRRTATNFIQARQMIADMLGKPLTNQHAGMVATLSRRSLDKILSGKAVAKSVDSKKHIMAAVNIDMLFENAVLGWVEQDKNNAHNVLGVHRLFAPLLIDNKAYLTKLTVKELMGSDGNRIYSVETLDIEHEKSSVPNMVATAQKSELTTRYHGASVIMLAQAIDDYNKNNPNLDNLDIRFSRMADFYDKNQDKAKEVLGKLGGVVNDFINNPKAFAKSAKQGAKQGVKDHLGKFLQFLGRRQLVELFGKKIDGLKAYSDRVAQMDADSNENAFRADKLAVKWGKLKDEQALAELMYDVTLKGIDPSRPYQTGDKAQYQRLKRQYDKLSDDAKAVYEQARDDYQDYYKNLYEAMTGRIKRNAKLSNERKQTLLDELDRQHQATRQVFFPLTRFGDYVVVVKDTDGNVVNISRAETKGQADKIRRELVRDNPNHHVGQVVLGRDMDIKKLGGVQGLVKEFLTDELDLGVELYQAYLNSLLDRQFANNNIELKNTAGFSQNARRAYAYHMSRGGHHVAKLRHTDQLRTELDRMQKHVDENVNNPDYDHITMQRVVDEMEKRHQLLLNSPTSPLSTLATSVGFMWYMGLSPASALVNVSQTFLVALPMMGTKFGGVKSAKMLGEISKILATNKNDLTDVLTGDEKKAFDEAVRRGVIDMTQAHDLAGIANGEDSRVSRALQKPMKIASFMFHQAEKYNRQVTYLASYRLGVEQGLTSEQAMEQAIKITYDGHFDYASSNRPRFMQGNWQKVLFLFKQYSQNMVYILTRQTYQAFKGETQQERIEARKVLVGILGLHALVAGVLGLPSAITVPFLAAFSALGGDDDDELTDNATEFRNALANLIGDDLAEVIAKGAPRAIGVDLSSRVGLDSLILPRLQDGLEGQRLGENVLAGLVGPVAGIGISMAKGYDQIKDGQTLQGIENMIPKALRDPLKAYRYATQGNVDKSGIEIVERENVGVSDIAQQAIGFRSGKFAQAQETKSAIFQADKQLTAIRSDLVRQYALAKRNGDDEQMDKIWEEIKRFNVKYPSNKITKPALMQSIHQRQRRIDDAKDGIYLSKNREYLREYGAFGVD